MFERIRDLAKEKGYSIPALETLAHLSRGAIRKWKTSTPNAEALLRVARILETTTDYLLTGEESVKDADQEDMIEYLQQIKDDPAKRIMFDLTKNATQEEVKATVAFLTALRRQD